MSFASARGLLDHPTFSQSDCLIADIRMPDMDGLSLYEELGRRHIDLPVIILTGYGNVALAVRTLRAGVVDFLEKPASPELLVHSVRRALFLAGKAPGSDRVAATAKHTIALLTERERQVLAYLLAGQSNKRIAYALDISPRTVEVYRARVMQKLNAHSLADVIRLAFAAGFSPSV